MKKEKERQKKSILASIQCMKYPVTITKLAKSTGYSHHIIRRNIALLTKKGEIHTRMVGGVTFIDVKEAELRKGA